MPAPFMPVPIAFTSGVRQDIARLASEPSFLRRAENVVFTKKGTIAGRPGLQSRDAEVQTSSVASLANDLESAVGDMEPAGIVAATFGTSTSTETALALWQGDSYFHRQTVWVKAGAHVSLRATTSAVLSVSKLAGSNRQNPAPVGVEVVGALTTLADSQGFPFLNASGEIDYIGTAAPTGYDATSRANCAAAGNAVFYISSSGSVYAQIPGVLPTTSVVVIGTGADVTAVPEQNIAAVKGDNDSYYVAYKRATLSQVQLVRVDSAGAVTATTTLTAIATDVLGVALAFSPATNRLGLMFIDSGFPHVNTTIYAVAPTTFTHVPIDLTLTGPVPDVQANIIGIQAGLTHSGLMSCAYVEEDGGCFITGRDFSSAAQSNSTTLHGVYTGFQTGVLWEPIFAGCAVGNRTLVGVSVAYDVLQHHSQWFVLDMTDLYDIGGDPRVVVAAGLPNQCDRIMYTGAGQPTADSLTFSIPVGFQFAVDTSDQVTVIQAAVQRIHLQLQPVQAVHAHGTTYLTGAVLRVFDGARMRVAHFPEEHPFILESSGMVAGGGLAAGSYSYQATWETVNGRGQIVRSGASNILTLTSAGTQRASINTTIPQLWQYLTPLDTVRLRLWGTVTNPSAGAAKFLVAETTITAAPAVGFLNLSHTVMVTGNEEQLYESESVLADQRPPGADRGVAYTGDRVWCADQNRLYCSKTLRPALATAWNTEDTHQLYIPSSLGQVQGLGSIRDRLVVICSDGIAVVSGQGFDDQGQGVGFSLEVIKGKGAGIRGPRSVCSSEDGVAYLGQDLDVWMVGANLGAQPISRPLREESVSDFAWDTLWTATRRNSEGSTNPMLLANGGDGWRVLDIENAQWGTWKFVVNDARYAASVNGAVWFQATSSPWIYSCDADAGADDGFPVTATIVTGVVRPENIKRGWGRVRGLHLSSFDPAVTLSVTARMFGDGQEREMMDKTLTFEAVPFSKWPDGAPEFRTSMQRCVHASLELQITPAAFEFSGVDLWVSSTREPAPSRSRG